MVIHIPPHRINNGQTGKAADRRRREPDAEPKSYITPSRSEINYIPGPESLMTMINSAVEAMRYGKYWDRGTILNLVV